ncbi:hypothetical protein FQA39_LY18025 [Lamprigera yunnana]|nr:hypothetical protein FQA39_LY18025 [Lamprigera yunnana]
MQITLDLKAFRVKKYINLYICGNHFDDKYKAVGTKRGLTATTIPTLYLPEPLEVQIVHNNPVWEQIDDPGSSLSSSANKPSTSQDGISPSFLTRHRSMPERTRLLRQVNVTRQRQLTPKARHLYQICKKWGASVQSLKSKLRKYTERLEMAQNMLKSKKFENLLAYINPTMYNFILSQIR